MPEKDRRSLHTGGCHCGNLKLQLLTELRPEEFEIRACQCSFCRKHATLAIADPKGEVELRVEEPEQFGRYSFGQRTIDFLLCRICGVYVGAVTRDGSLRALVIVNVLDSRKASQLPVPATRLWRSTTTPSFARIDSSEDVRSGLPSH